MNCGDLNELTRLTKEWKLKIERIKRKEQRLVIKSSKTGCGQIEQLLVLGDTNRLSVSIIVIAVVGYVISEASHE